MNTANIVIGVGIFCFLLFLVQNPTLTIALSFLLIGASLKANHYPGEN